MILSRSTGYGMVAVAYIAKNKESAWTQADIISKEYDIPIEYLLKIMGQLVRSGILVSKRGPMGGFSLARPAKEISLLEVIEAIDGPIKRSFEISEQAKNQRFAKKMQEVVSKATSQAAAVLNKARLSDLL